MSPRTTHRRSEADLEAALGERLSRLSEQEARIESSLCLYCYDAPCMQACPTSIDIPGFINRIATGDRIGAATRILEANVLGATCARVCATEELCEGACVLEPHEGPIKIGELQRFATDLLVEQDRPIPYAAGPDTGKRVAVIGGGPAGLAAAARLRQAGHGVTIFERQPRLGGLATYGIIPLREPSAIAEWEAEQVLALGVDAVTGVAVGVDVSIDTLRGDFDAVFLATGAGARVTDVGIQGGDADGVEDALEFIERVRTVPHTSIPVGDDVVVIGAGNTAMDACTIAARLGAENVTCVYRRTEAEMTGYPSEYEHCLRDGVRFRWLTQPIRVVTDDNGRVTGLECARVTLGAPGPDGRPTPTITDDTFIVPADHVMCATGQQREPQLFEQFGVHVQGGRPVVDSEGRTSVDGIFAGGDSVMSGKELSVVDAVASGRDVAATIDAWLTKERSNG